MVSPYLIVCLCLGIFAPYLVATQDGLSLSGKPFDTGTSRPALDVHIIYFYREPELKRLCALESTLRSNPAALVHVHTANATTFIKQYKKTPLNLLHPHRVVVHETSFRKLFKGTLLEQWYLRRQHRRSRWPNQQLANAARLAVLLRHGGTYMDLDYIVQLKLDQLSVNFMALQAKSSVEEVKTFKGHHINNGFLRFEAGHPFLSAALHHFVQEYKGSEWGRQGPDLMTRTYGRTCAFEQNASAWCQDLVVGGFKTVYPFSWKLTRTLLQKGEGSLPQDLVERVRAAPAVHFWSHVWGDTRMRPGSFLAALMAEGCPICATSMLR